MRRMEALWDIKERGFLPTKVSEDFYCEALKHHVSVYESLPDLAKEGLLKERLESLPLVRIVFEYESYFDSSCVLVEDMADAENLFTLLSILASSYVHRLSAEFAKKSDEAANAVSSPKIPLILPACLAQPLKQIAAHVQRKPILDYAGCVLNNWTLYDQTKPMSLENLRILRTFTRLPAEEWFYKIHIMIEFHGGEAIRAIDSIQQIHLEKCNYEEDNEYRSIEKVIACMERMVDSLRSMNGILDKMKDGCKHHEFYIAIRPWLSGWSAPGVVYATFESNDFEPEVLSGGSGAQSSLMPCLDTFLGVLHGFAAARVEISQDNKRGLDPASRNRFIESLKKYREYMPKPHRDYIEHLETSMNIRDYIKELEQSQADLVEKSKVVHYSIADSEQYHFKSVNLGRFINRIKARYNEAIDAVLSFRAKHVGFAISYISTQASARARALEAEGDVKTSKALVEKSTTGTGGSQFKDHLMQHLSDTRRCLYQIPVQSVSQYPERLEFYSSSSMYYASKPPCPDHIQARRYVLPGLGPQLPAGSLFGKHSLTPNRSFASFAFVAPVAAQTAAPTLPPELQTPKPTVPSPKRCMPRSSSAPSSPSQPRGSNTDSPDP